MRIAVCLSGQARTWKKCLPRWREVFKDHEVDFFFHLWDYNTLPSQADAPKDRTTLLPPLEKLLLVANLNPIKFMFEPQKPIEYWNCDIPVDKQFGPWCREQFYSMYRVSLLKQQYEIENNFRYDVAVRLRGDLMLLGDIELKHPAPNTAYTTHNKWDEKYWVHRVGDIFFYADSHTFDQMCEFYKYLSFMPTDYVTKADCPPPEIALYNYMANIGIQNFAVHSDVKIMRTKEYEDIMGELANYETI
jgi:hypothetical protein